MLASPNPRLETLDLWEVCEMERSKSSSAASKKALEKQAMEVPEMEEEASIEAPWVGTVTEAKTWRMKGTQRTLNPQSRARWYCVICSFYQTWARVACLPFLAWVFALFWHNLESFASKCNPASFNLYSSLWNFPWYFPIHHSVSLLLQAKTTSGCCKSTCFGGVGIQVRAGRKTEYIHYTFVESMKS